MCHALYLRQHWSDFEESWWNGASFCTLESLQLCLKLCWFTRGRRYNYRSKLHDIFTANNAEDCIIYWSYDYCVFILLMLVVKTVDVNCSDFCCVLDTLSYFSVTSVNHLFADLQYLSDVRQQIPITAQRRHDLYSVKAEQESWGEPLWPRDTETCKHKLCNKISAAASAKPKTCYRGNEMQSRSSLIDCDSSVLTALTL